MTFVSDTWLLLWIAVVAFFTSRTKKYSEAMEPGQEPARYSLFFSFLVFLPVLLFASLGEVRADTGTYLSSFDTLSLSISDVFQNWWNEKGPGFILIKVLIKTIFGNDRTAFRVIVALIQSIPLVIILRKYSCNYIFSVFLFIAMQHYVGWMMNGIRQFVAVCIVMTALPLLLKKKLVPALLIVLLAITVHSSAIMMIPIFCVVGWKPWSKRMLFSFFIFIIALFVYVNNTDLIHEEILATDDGSNPLRILVSAITPVLAYVAREKIEKDNNPLINICVNMSVFTTLIYFVATFTNGIGTGRLPIYTGIFNLILIPYLCEKAFNEKVSRNIKVFYILFYSFSFILGVYFGIF